MWSALCVHHHRFIVSLLFVWPPSVRDVSNWVTALVWDSSSHLHGGQGPLSGCRAASPAPPWLEDLRRTVADLVAQQDAATEWDFLRQCHPLAGEAEAALRKALRPALWRSRSGPADCPAGGHRRTRAERREMSLDGPSPPAEAQQLCISRR